MDYRDKRIVVIDFETYYNKKEGFDLKALSVVEYVRDSRFWPHGMAYRWFDEDKTHWLAGIHPIEAWVAAVDWKNTVVVAHNVRFDGSILVWRFKARPFAWMDTVGLAKAVLGENVSGYSLKRLAEYLGMTPKGEISCEGVLHPSPEQLVALGEYCKTDVDICKGIYEKLIPQFPQSQLSAMDWTIRVFVEPKLCLSIEILAKGVEDEKMRREETIKKSGVAKDTLSSNKKFATWLTEHGYKVPTKQSARTGQLIPAFAKTDEGLSQLAIAAPELYAARIASKSNLLETRGESLLAVAKTGTFPFDVGFSGAVQTHRYSGGSGAGGNPQNFTRGSFLRSAICSPKAHKLIVGDFAAIELRLLAWLAKEPKLMSKLVNNEDVYADFASTKYGRKITKADKAERQYGKESILGLGYQMGAEKFKTRIKTVMGIDITKDDAWKTVDLYRTTYFNVPKLWEQAYAILPLLATGKVGCLWFAPFIKVKKGALVLPSGLEIKYPDLRYGEFFDNRSKEMVEGWHYTIFFKTYESEETSLYGGKLIENICQALAGELCKEAIERAEADGINCVGQVHDEILALSREGCSDHDVQMDAHFLKLHMEKAPVWMPSLRLKAEIGYGLNWNDAKV